MQANHICCTASDLDKATAGMQSYVHVHRNKQHVASLKDIVDYIHSLTVHCKAYTLPLQYNTCGTWYIVAYTHSVMVHCRTYTQPQAAPGVWQGSHAISHSGEATPQAHSIQQIHPASSHQLLLSCHLTAALLTAAHHALSF